jgi:hypothetical protein
MVRSVRLTAWLAGVTLASACAPSLVPVDVPVQEVPRRGDLGSFTTDLSSLGVQRLAASAMPAGYTETRVELMSVHPTAPGEGMRRIIVRIVDQPGGRTVAAYFKTYSPIPVQPDWSPEQTRDNLLVNKWRREMLAHFRCAPIRPIAEQVEMDLEDPDVVCRVGRRIDAPALLRLVDAADFGEVMIPTGVGVPTAWIDVRRNIPVVTDTNRWNAGLLRARGCDIRQMVVERLSGADYQAVAFNCIDGVDSASADHGKRVAVAGKILEMLRYGTFDN